MLSVVSTNVPLASLTILPCEHTENAHDAQQPNLFYIYHSIFIITTTIIEDPDFCDYYHKQHLSTPIGDCHQDRTEMGYCYQDGTEITYGYQDRTEITYGYKDRTEIGYCYQDITEIRYCYPLFPNINILELIY